MGFSSETFLSTLSQISATILVLLLGGILTYITYIHQKKSTYQDNISQERLAIRESLLRIRKTWSQGLGMFVPVKLEECYKNLTPGAGGMDLWIGAFASTLFEEGGHQTNIHKSVYQANSTFLENPEWIWAVRLWIMYKMVDVLTYDLFAPDNLSFVFPSASVELGFDKWRENYEKLFRRLNLIKSYEKDLPDGMARHLMESSNDTDNTAYAIRVKGIVADALQELFQEMSGISARISTIDRLEITQKRSLSVSQMKWRWVIFFAAFALLCGVLIPLLFMIFDSRIPSIAGVGIMSIVFVSLTISILLFSQQLAREHRPLPDEYVIKRWFKPLIETVNRHSESINKGELLEITVFQDARSIGKEDGLPAIILREVEEYIIAAVQYNKSLNKLGHMIADEIYSNYNGAAKPPIGRGGASFNVVNWLSSDHRNKFLDGVFASNTAILLHLKSSVWTRDMVWIPLDKWQGSLEDLKEVFNNIMGSINKSPEADLVLKSIETINQRVDSLSRLLGKKGVSSI